MSVSIQIHGHRPSSEASHEVPNCVLPDYRSLDCSHSDINSLCLLCLWDHIPSWRHHSNHSQSLLRPDMACGPAGLLSVLLPVCFCCGVRRARDRHGAVLHPHLPWALVQKRAGLPDGADKEEATLSPQDSDGPHWDFDSVHHVLGAVLRLHNPAWLSSDAHLPPEELPCSFLHHWVYRHE